MKTLIKKMQDFKDRLCNRGAHCFDKGLSEVGPYAVKLWRECTNCGFNNLIFQYDFSFGLIDSHQVITDDDFEITDIDMLCELLPKKVVLRDFGKYIKTQPKEQLPTETDIRKIMKKSADELNLLIIKDSKRELLIEAFINPEQTTMITNVVRSTSAMLR